MSTFWSSPVVISISSQRTQDWCMQSFFSKYWMNEKSRNLRHYLFLGRQIHFHFSANGTALCAVFSLLNTNNGGGMTCHFLQSICTLLAILYKVLHSSREDYLPILNVTCKFGSHSQQSKNKCVIVCIWNQTSAIVPFISCPIKTP